MKLLRLTVLLAALAASAQAATTYTEFYCRDGGDNLNSGSTTNVASIYTGVGDSDGTSVFTPSDGSTPASTVSAGMWGSVYVTSGATTNTFTGYITQVAAGVNGAITFSTTSKVGTFPSASGGAHTISCKVGGAWKGPNAGVQFPFGYASQYMTNAASTDMPRVRLLNDAAYAITSGLAQNFSGPLRFQGCNTDLTEGKATIEGGTVATAFVALTVSGLNTEYVDLIFSHNGAAGGQIGVSGGSAETLFLRCVFTGMNRSGITATGAIMVECEAYGNNTQNTAGFGGFNLGGCLAVRCIAHDNTTANSSGFAVTSGMLVNCIADSNGSDGFNVSSTTTATLFGCDAYANGGDGIDLTAASAMTAHIENCNLVKNTGYGINSSASTVRSGLIRNCGFGAGTQVNGSGAIAAAASSLEAVGSVTYADDVTPWNDPATGDFSITLAAAKRAGLGTFTQTATSYTGTLAHPDIGAAAHNDNASAPTTRATPFVQ